MTTTSSRRCRAPRAAASIWLVLALRQFVQQTLTVVSDILADRLGTKQLILRGCGG